MWLADLVRRLRLSWILIRFGRLDQTSDSVSERLRLSRLVLNLLDRSTDADLWAAFRFEEGRALLASLESSPCDRVESAIEAIRESLEITMREQAPEDWSLMMITLGTAYSERADGNKAENLDTAISCYQSALPVLEELEIWDLWAKTMTDLGSALADHHSNDPLRSIEPAIACFRLAEAIQKKEDLARISHQATETDSVDHSGRRFEAWRLPRASELVPMWTFLRFFSSTVTD